MSHEFPKKFSSEAFNEEGLPYSDVYDAEEVDKWLEDLRKYLRDEAYDRQTVQHGNVALRILNQFFPRPLRDLRLILSSQEGPSNEPR